jgi:SAM-dependent methyltransferase
MIGDVSQVSVLDIGCGTGFLLDHITPGAYTGIDISQAMLDRLLTKHPERQKDVIHTSLASFADGKRYDLIVALFGTASYLSQDELERTPCLLAPGGRLFLMFYAPGYYPMTYAKTGISINHEAYNGVPSGQVTHWQTYVIVEG